jgi:polyphosphate:AMP phosphotransferase
MAASDPSIFAESERSEPLSKAELEALEPRLRVGLINAQFDLKSAGFSVLILIAGNDRVGCNDLVDLLHEWMDVRGMDTHVVVEPSQEERERPLFWRYWRALPARGRIGVHLGAWPIHFLRQRVFGGLGREEFDGRMAHARAFETCLVDDGTLLLKFWVHAPFEELAERLGRDGKKARKGRKGASNWQVEADDRQVFEHYDEAIAEAQRYVEGTTTPRTPWTIVGGGDAQRRDLEVARAILAALRARLDAPPAAPRAVELAAAPAAGPGRLAEVDLSRTIDEVEYERKLEKRQERLHELALRAREAGQTSVVVFEGWDAAGKGGAIRRLTRPLSARDYEVASYAAPTAEERAYPWLWRFWRRLPRAGRMLIFDRSHYGRVLVERVEGFAKVDEWERAYGEIDDFEAQLCGHGIVVLKFWLHVSQGEQLARFRARQQTPYKKYKITEEDFRNRQRWDEYVQAVDEMVARTHSEHAPWHLIPAEDKRVARLEVLKHVNRALERALERRD